MSDDEIAEYLNNKGISNFELVKGDILQTIDEYIEQHPSLRIALLHIDTDVYEPSKAGLEKLFDRVVRTGVIVFDDYGVVEGETKAVDEFLDEHPEYTLHKLTISHVIPAYLVK